MARLIANTPCAGLLPQAIGTVSLHEIDAGRITLVAPFKGQNSAVSAIMASTFGMSFPAPNRVTGTDPRAIWCGMGQAWVMGIDCHEITGAACVDQSDAWAIVRIDGADSAAILARLTPLDLRPAVFANGHTARTLVGHMTASVIRHGATAFDVMVMRSMAATLVHELARASENIADRANLPT